MVGRMNWKIIQILRNTSSEEVLREESGCQEVNKQMHSKRRVLTLKSSSRTEGILFCFRE